MLSFALTWATYLLLSVAHSYCIYTCIYIYPKVQKTIITIAFSERTICHLDLTVFREPLNTLPKCNMRATPPSVTMFSLFILQLCMSAQHAQHIVPKSASRSSCPEGKQWPHPTLWQTQNKLKHACPVLLREA